MATKNKAAPCDQGTTTKQAAAASKAVPWGTDGTARTGGRTAVFFERWCELTGQTVVPTSSKYSGTTTQHALSVHETRCSVNRHITTPKILAPVDVLGEQA